jgi:hypothetical protein
MAGFEEQNLANMDEVFKQLIFGSLQITNLAEFFWDSRTPRYK